jgi:glycosyltransferase involved in cell wall biosynthesis
VGLGGAQAAAGLEVSVVTTYPAGADLSPGEVLRGRGVKVHTIGPAHWPLQRCREIGPRLEELIAHTDVVHIHALWEEVQHQAAVRAGRRGVPYLITPHGMLDPWSLSQGWLKKRIYMALRMRRDLDRAAAIHYTADAERDLAVPLGLRSPALIEVNGVDLTEFQTLPPKGEFRKLYPQIGQRPMLLFLSRIHLKKGLDMLVPSMAKVKTAGAVLVIAGPDYWGYGDVIKGLVKEHGIEDRVIFAGKLPAEVRVAAFRDADLFVLPSYQENFGIAVAEALAAGTPVVISDQVNIHREISGGGVGGVVPRDEDRLAAEIDRWLQDEPMRRSAAEKARPFVWERYDWMQIARRWVGHYEAIAGR